MNQPTRSLAHLGIDLDTYFLKYSDRFQFPELMKCTSYGVRDAAKICKRYKLQKEEYDIIYVYSDELSSTDEGKVFFVKKDLKRELEVLTQEIKIEKNPIIISPLIFRYIGKNPTFFNYSKEECNRTFLTRGAVGMLNNAIFKKSCLRRFVVYETAVAHLGQGQDLYWLCGRETKGMKIYDPLFMKMYDPLLLPIHLKRKETEVFKI